MDEKQNLNERFQAIVKKGIFHRYEESKRTGELPKQQSNRTHW
jgi:hypothetical protein